jgi:hypothetical protein
MVENTGERGRAGEQENDGVQGRVWETGGAGEPAGERFGPLRIERYVKDDGRALILYARAEEEPR